MRAAIRTRWGKPEQVVRVVDAPQPALADDGVLVRVRAASLNRYDYYSVAPALLLRPLLGGLRRPKTEALGGDFAGVVEAVGRDVTGFEQGDEVFGARTGAFAEYVCARMVAHKPPNVTFEQAAAVPLGGVTALQAVRDHGRLEPGGHVLVNGASGSVGPFAVQIARALGAGSVTAVCSTRNVGQTRALGADRVIDYTADDFTRMGERYDLVVDVAGNRSWSELRRVLEPDAAVVLVGVPLSSNPLLGPLGAIARRWATSRRGRQRLVFFTASYNRADLETLGELLAAGQITPVVEEVYPLDRVADALRLMGEGHARAKLVLTI